MPRVLVLFAHPALEKSRVHRRLAARVPDRPGLTFHDLYEHYPDGDVDVAREQALLAAHDVVVLQHPFYWYSTPPLVKTWEDLVLEHGWAYGSQGRMLEGKFFLSLVSAGGGSSAYGPGTLNRFTIRQLLAPLEATATLCRMRYLPPYVIPGTHRLDEPQIDAEALRYHALLELLHDGGIDLEAALAAESMNAVLAQALGARDAALAEGIAR